MSDVRRAAANYRRFHGRPVKKVSRVEFTMPKSLTFLGDVKAIEYVSDKKMHTSDTSKKKRLYRHDTGPGVKMYLHPNKRAVIIMGGRFRVNNWLRD